MCWRCTRIWCVRPVSSAAFDQRARGRSARARDSGARGLAAVRDRHARARCADRGRPARRSLPLAGGLAVHEREVVALHACAPASCSHEGGLRVDGLARRPAARSCPCRGGARCRRAARRRAPARARAARSAACRSRLPAPGCTTRPAGLSMTISAASSCTILSGIFCARGAPASGRRGGVERDRSPPVTGVRGERRAPSTLMCPSRSQSCRRLREYCGEEPRERLVEAQPAASPRGTVGATRRDEARIPVAYNCLRDDLHACEVYLLPRCWPRWPLAGCGCSTRRTTRRRLVGADASTARRRTRMDEPRLAEGDQVLREARGALSLRPLRAAGAARGRLLPLEGRRARLGDRGGRALHQAPPQPPERRLRLVPEGAGQLQRDLGMLVVAHDAGHDRPRPESRARSVRAFKELVTRFPESRYADGFRRAHALPRQRARRATRCTSRAITSGAAPTSPRPTARSTRSRHYPQAPGGRGSDVRSWSRRTTRSAWTRSARRPTRVLMQELPEEPLSSSRRRPKKDVPWWRLWDPRLVERAILVIGAAGMIGRKLVERLCEGTAARDELVLHDVVVRRRRPERRSSGDAGISDLRARRSREAGRHAARRHLPPRGDRLGRSGSRLRQGLPHQSRRHAAAVRSHPKIGDGYRPRVVFTSSIAVFGAPFPDAIGDEFLNAPLTSYGTQKAIGELLLSDYSRRGFFDGIGMRLPTICVRPGKPNKAASGFFSGIIREPLARRRRRCCRCREACATGSLRRAPRSVSCCTRRRSKRAQLGARRNLSMPGISRHRRRADRGAAKVAGDKAVRRIRREPDATDHAHRRGLAAQLRRAARARARLPRRRELRGDHPDSHRRRARLRRNAPHFLQARACASSAAGSARSAGRKACRQQPRVAEHQHAAVGLVADQAAGALLELHAPPAAAGVHERVAALRLRVASMRAASTGSSGGANGSLSMTTSDSASPRTSTPSQKTALPSSTALPSARKRASSSVREPVALHEQRIVEAARRTRQRARSRAAQRAQRGEQQERAAAARLDHRQRRVDHRVGVAGDRSGRRQAARHVQQRLRRRSRTGCPSGRVARRSSRARA